MPFGVYHTRLDAHNFISLNNLQELVAIELVDQSDNDIGFSDMMHMDNWYNGADGFSDFY